MKEWLLDISVCLWSHPRTEKIMHNPPDIFFFQETLWSSSMQGWARDKPCYSTSFLLALATLG
jgi:hypothetical protein